MHFAQTSAALHFCWLTAHLYEDQISIGVTAVAQGCFQPVLQSSTEQWGLHVALKRAAMHWCWVTAHMCEQHISIGELQWHKAASSLFCRAALNSGDCMLP